MYGIYVTIGATSVYSTFVIPPDNPANGGPPAGSPEAGTYYEFVRVDSGRIFLPDDYVREAGTDMDICLIKLQQAHIVEGSGQLHVGKAFISYCSSSR